MLSDDAKQMDPIALEPEAPLITAKDIEEAARKMATLPILERELLRVKEAARLGIRTSMLDQAINQCSKTPETAKQGQAIEFAEIEPWPWPVDGANLLHEIAEIFKRYVSLPPKAEVSLALWVVFSYCFDEGDVAPILLLNSPVKRCGKTTTLSVLNRLCYRPQPTSNVTAAALFRIVEAYTPTLLIDEADSFMTVKEELRGIINSGHTRHSARVFRLVGDDHEPRAFSTWCPKVVAGIGRMPETIEDRAIIITLQRKQVNDVVDRLRARDGFPETRRRIVRWRRDHLQALKAVRLDPPPFLNDRAADNWEPLLTIAKLCGGDWLERALDAARPKEIATRSDGPSVELLHDIRTAFGENDRLPTSELLSKLISDPEKPWRSFHEGQPLNPRQLARLLDGFAISSQTIRISSGTPKGYKKSQFADAWQRYLS